MELAGRAKEEAEESAHRERLRNADLISGKLAEAKLAAEWSGRQKHEVAYAESLLEKTLVEVEAMGRDAGASAEASATPDSGMPSLEQDHTGHDHAPGAPHSATSGTGN